MTKFPLQSAFAGVLLILGATLSMSLTATKAAPIQQSVSSEINLDNIHYVHQPGQMAFVDVFEEHSFAIIEHPSK